MRALLAFSFLFTIACTSACGSFRESSTQDADAGDPGAVRQDGGSGATPPPGLTDGAAQDAPSDSTDPHTGDGDASVAPDAPSVDGAPSGPPTIVWEVDGVVVASLTTFEAFYIVSQGTYGMDFPHWGRSIQAWLPKDPVPGTIVSCPTGGTGNLSLITSDNSYAGLGALPDRWKNLTFVSCGAQNGGDVVTARDLIITTVSPARIAGSYEILVQGAGVRAGSTLRVHGVFDVAPQTQ